MQPRISPDGKRILLRKVGTNCELWMYDIPRGSLARIVQGNDNHDPIWSPDGRQIAFLRANPPTEMVTLTVAGAREKTTLAQGANPGSPESWSAGGNLLAYTVNGRGTRSDVWVRAMGGASPPAAFLATEFNESDPAISPDGRWIAYVSNETGTVEVFVRPYPDTGTAWQISTGGGGSPLWSRDGRELFFVAGTRMMAVPIETRPTFRAGTPVALFDGGFSIRTSRTFDVAPDGRFVAVRTASGGIAGQELRVLLGWESEMKRVGVARH
jgi:serine/threonine-protein kinase